jgi:hypothetical protein
MREERPKFLKEPYKEGVSGVNFSFFRTRDSEEGREQRSGKRLGEMSPDGRKSSVLFQQALQNHASLSSRTACCSSALDDFFQADIQSRLKSTQFLA